MDDAPIVFIGKNENAGGLTCFNDPRSAVLSIFMLIGDRIGTLGEASAKYDNEDDGQGNRKDTREPLQKQDDIPGTIRQPQANPIDKQRAPNRHQHSKHDCREDLPAGHYSITTGIRQYGSATIAVP